MRFLLAHLSDAHLGPIPRPSLRELAGKRLTGYLNWLCRRSEAHDMDVLGRLVADMAAQRPHHIAMTGDVVNIGLDAEIARAARWLSSLGAPSEVSFTPGNHDAYVRASVSRVEEAFAPWTTSDEAGSGFPYLRRRGPVALIGLSSAAPTPPFFATGRLGAGQRERLAALLDATRAEGLARVVLLHHPPHRGGAKFLRGLDDANAFEAVIARHGAEIVLHGHNHKTSVHRLSGPDGPVPVVGAASASAKAGTKSHRAAYTLFSIERRDGTFAMSARLRGVRDGGNGIEDLGALEL